MSVVGNRATPMHTQIAE